MNEIEPSGEYVPTNTLAKQGVSAIAYTAGGVLLFVMNILGARFRILGIILGLGVCGLGAGALRSKDPEDKKPGLFLCISGALELVFQFGIPVLKPIAGTLLGVGAFGLIALGIWKGLKFLKALKSRR